MVEWRSRERLTPRYLFAQLDVDDGAWLVPLTAGVDCGVVVVMALWIIPGCTVWELNNCATY